MTSEDVPVDCGLCGESQAAIRASQRTDDPIYCFDGDAEYPTHRFTNRVPFGAATTGWKRRGTSVPTAARKPAHDLAKELLRSGAPFDPLWLPRQESNPLEDPVGPTGAPRERIRVIPTTAQRTVADARAAVASANERASR